MSDEFAYYTSRLRMYFARNARRHGENLKLKKADQEKRDDDILRQLLNTLPKRHKPLRQSNKQI